MYYKFRFTKINSQNRLGEFESYTPSSLLLGVVVGYNKKNQSITVQFNNLLNEIHYNHLSRIKTIMPEPGRSIIFNYNLFF